jgi:hypothetical protein
MKEVTNDKGLKMKTYIIKHVNTSKNKSNSMQPKTQNINCEEYQKVSDFKNLGSVVTYNSDCGKNVQA